ncbi:NUDIX domain-containing protein [Candidatus Peribacteria bacterium]|jgi:putative (di)nucleoside polyphosphate hydrolase|nr:NUDIX domain-containing protein [Candidatus Peribacteria bacterium]MBT4021495.1 NUDIX domain-containing protein [Candidatus Peribacteria bacterium]MBT4240405.1 NUDIX domain-containing protein [Candidatus Peribacteria bacterium]MBT4473828.1 NUDIX domain-containing protein [Candidatus Peribacteria bacterium]
MYSQYRHCVSALITRKDGKVLLVHKPRKDDAWQIAQGGIEEGENEKEAASRELMEETGIEVAPDKFEICDQTYQYDFPEHFIKAENPKYIGQKLIFVKAEVPNDTEVKVDQRELDDFKWVEVEEIMNYILRKEYLEVILSILD